MVTVLEQYPHNFLFLMHTPHTELLEKARALFPMIPDNHVLVLCRDRETAQAYTGIGRSVMQDWDDKREVDGYLDAIDGGPAHGNPVVFFADTTHGDIMRMLRVIFDTEDRISPWYSMSLDGTLIE